MKTAMQELIEKFQEYNKPKTKGLVRISMSLDNVIEFCEKALEKEKEQIIEAHQEGWSDAYDYLQSDSNDRARQADEYYNETYQNK